MEFCWKPFASCFSSQAIKDISPATACALVLTHAYAGLWAPQFLEAGLRGGREKLWGMEGVGFSDGRFFEKMSFRGMDICLDLTYLATP